MKIVIDTNCLLRILPKNAQYRCLWDAFLRGEFELCYTTDMFQEYREILSRYYSAEFAELVIDTIYNAPNAEPVTLYYKWQLISADPDDNKFVDCAISANANFIVTNDKHFNILKEIDFPKINAIDIETFKKMI